MRKIFLVVVFSLFICSMVHTSTADITVKVTVRFLSVSVDAPEYDFGFMDVGEVKLATSAITAKNESNCAVSFQLKLTNPPNPTPPPPDIWTAISAGAPLVDQYKLSAIFRNLLPAISDYVDNEDSVSDGFVTASGTVFAKNVDGEGEKGYNVTVDATRKLWLRFYAPSGTNVKTQQLIPITVKALTF